MAKVLAAGQLMGDAQQKDVNFFQQEMARVILLLVPLERGEIQVQR